MLKNTFLHLDGIGKVREQRIWKSGVRCWSDFLEDPGAVGFSDNRLDRLVNDLKVSLRKLSRGDCSFFSKALYDNEHWRLYSEFSDGTGFLDIETTGLSRTSEVTVIGLFDGERTHTYVNGQNLNDFCRDVQDYDLLVTFNGSCFDLPFLTSKFPDLNFEHAHIDLRWVLKRIGLSGGLKHIEQVLGLGRSDDTEGLSGRDAVRLWKEYCKGNQESLDTLVQYNKEDVVNLKQVLELVYPRLIEHVFRVD